MHIVDKLHWCVMEMSSLVYTAYHLVQLAYGDANLGWTSSRHRYGKCTENVLFRVLLVFFLSSIYGEQKETL